MTDIVDTISDLQLPKSDVWVSEAEFGYRYVKDYCEQLEPGCRVLEIGCGSGILLAMLSSEFKSLTFKGIEPFGDGFSSLLRLNEAVRNSGVHIDQIGYEEYDSTESFDLIFCVNVFEHVEDWQHFLRQVTGMLGDTGKLLILCPNYGFPYEPHFKIPVVVNKGITYKLFKKHIQNFEVSDDSAGLWQSLNFVKKRQVFNYLNQSPETTNLIGLDDTGIIDKMISRIDDDAEFAKRQRVLGTIARLLQRTGLLNIVKWFANYLPYMKLEISRAKSR